MLLIVVVVAALAVSTLRRHITKPDLTTGCVVKSTYSMPLSASQAAIAATIAGVAQQRQMPQRAVAIAYATAFQESGLANLPYGDRDSVGVFQQRPSQGWGTRQELLDPAYASAKFFAALARVPGYLQLPIYQAAQDVQRSADGTAYDQYAPQGTIMASGFTGAAPRSVWCWFGAGVTGPAHLITAASELDRIFGTLPSGAAGSGIKLAQSSRAAAGSVTVRVTQSAAGWTVATWLVTHADQYGIRNVRFAGYHWTASAGQDGWRPDTTGGQRGATASAVAFG